MNYITTQNKKGHTGRLLKSLCFTSLTFLLLHIIFQITINSLQAGNSINPGFNCSMWEKSIRQIGFESVRGADPGNGIRVFIPDVGMFVAGLATWLLCRSLVQKTPTEDMAQYNTDFENDEQDERLEIEGEVMFDEDFEVGDECGMEEEELEEEEEELEEEEEEEEEEESIKLKILRRVAGVASKLKEVIGNIITTAGKVVVTILLGLTGIMLPSLTSAVYFFTFLGLCTWWSFCRTFDPLIFSCLCVLMAIFSAGHLIGLYLYQFQFFQEFVPPRDFYARLFGVTPVIQTNCSTPWMIISHPNLLWFHYINPVMLLVLYYTLATLIRLWLQEPIEPMDIDEEENPELEEEKNQIVVTAEKRRRMWQAVRYATEERKILLVKVNGTPVDYHNMTSTLAIENGPAKLDVYSTPQYKVDRADDTSEKKEGSDYDYEVDEVNKEEEPSEEEENPKVHAVVTVFRFIMKQSYICALIAMMAWSITYHSWLTFVLLIWSCTLWMIRNRRKYAMLTSPFMVFYGNLLLSLQYIWSIDVDEIPKVSGILEKKGEPFAELGSKVHYDWWRRILKYFWMSVVVYTMFVLILVYTYQFESSPRVWSNMTGMDEEKLKDLGLEKFGVAELFTRIFIPTSFLLVCILHLHYFHDHFLELTDLKTLAAKQDSTIYRLKDLGLEKFGVAELFTRIFIPTSFLLVCILHLHYFHDHFLELTDLKTLAAKQDSTIYRLVHQDGSLVDITMMNMTTSTVKEEVEEKSQVEIDEKGEEKEPEDSGDKGGSRHCSDGDQPSGAETLTEETSDFKNKWHLVIDRLTVLFLKFLEYFHKLQLFVWWLFELHIIKVVSSYIIWITVKESLNWTEEKKKDMMTSLLYNKSIDPSNWVGLKKSYPLLEYLRNNLLMLALLAFEITIYRHQEYYRLKNNLTAPATKTIFHAITRHHLDDGIVNCAKYFVNYFFYKFGLETCFLMAINVIGQRMDFYAMLHAFCLVAVMYRRRRKAIAEIWPKYCCFLACILTFQYFICIGIPPAACKDYPWRFQGSGMDSNVIKWLYFPDFHTSPNSVFLVYDFMLLLCASLQREVFEDENKAAVRILAGDNVEICRDLDAASFSQHNPVPDFIHCRSYLDMLKVAMFSYLFWFVLTIIFITGTTRISIFCMGYLVACFYFLLFGGGLLLKPIKVILHFWDFLIAYNVFVITMKNVLSYLDMLKVAMFSYLFWFVLTIIFITGTTRISIFCMGYLVACFYFLLFGGGLLLKPIKVILHFWDFLIAYNVFVITMKNVLSIAACGYIGPLVKNCCWLVQTLSLACTIKEYKPPEKTENCDLPRDEAGIIWDSICFAFLLLQRRVFMSYYFLHVVADIRASQILASRGAELFQATIVKAVKARIEEEKKSMDQLKRQFTHRGFGLCVPWYTLRADQECDYTRLGQAPLLQLPPGASVPRCMLSPWYFGASVRAVLGARVAQCTPYLVHTVRSVLGT
ncbi:UNVERIFIED_CONTAM: hypothetical protein FKN15_042819 [Acipenser sinensis]